MKINTFLADEALAEAAKQNPRIQFIRNINKDTDPKDDGLRMPLVHESKLKVKKAKKKKKK
jgi:F-box/leucine-rich repeat protein 2/20